MRRFALLFLILALVSCSRPSVGNAQPGVAALKPGTGYTWTKVLDEGPWAKNYNFQMFAVENRLWIFHSDGNWSSEDGLRWTRSPLTNVIRNHAFLDYVQFKGAIYGLGNFDGNIEEFTFRPEIFRTRDLKRWDTLSRNSNLPKRFFCHPFVFEDKIWIIGGEDKTTQYADIWNSADAIAWSKVRDNLPFGKRSGSKVVTLNGKLYLLNNDVWTSSNGLDWQQVTPEIVKGEQIFGYNAIVFDGKIWLLGCNRNGQFSSQVLVSADGKNWEGQNAPWSPRGGISAAVYRDKVYMTGGKYGGTPNAPNFIYSNDLWVLSKNPKNNNADQE